MGKDLERASAGDAVTLTVHDDLDIARGDVIAAEKTPRPVVAEQFAAHVIWMSDQPMLPGRSYLIACGTSSCARSDHRTEIHRSTSIRSSSWPQSISISTK